MSSLRLLLLLVVWITVVSGEPLRARKIRREVNSALRPLGRGKDLLTEATIGHVLFNAPKGARLIATSPRIPSIEKRLPANYSRVLIGPLKDTFSCDGRVYGYYGDVDNNCQIFHVCLPLKQIFPEAFPQAITYHFTFLCNIHLRFTQDALVCAWEEEAVPCEATPELYWMNLNHFRKIPDPEGSGEKYAELNSPLPQDS